MKMAIFGAQAPKCEKKPSNPTSTSVIGTMYGQNAGKGKTRGATASTAHRPQYQGLLQAPRLSEIFDH